MVYLKAPSFADPSLSSLLSIILLDLHLSIFPRTLLLFVLDHGLLIHSEPADALIGSELSCRDFLFEHFVDLFQCSALDFRQEEVDPDTSYGRAWEPDVAVSRTPVQRIRVDEIYTTEDQLRSLLRIVMFNLQGAVNVVSHAAKNATAAANPNV